MTQEDPQEYSFLITVPKERLQDMQQAMEHAQLPFHPLRDITADVDAFMPGVNLGSGIPGAVEEINKYLAFFDDHPRVPSDYDTWPPERALQFLHMANENFPWDSDTKTILEATEHVWTEIAAQYPEAFNSPH